VVLNDFFEFRFQPLAIPPPSLLHDLKSLVNNPDLSDVTFIVEGQPVSHRRGTAGAARWHGAGKEGGEDYTQTGGGKDCLKCFLEYKKVDYISASPVL
jgi:hypothetical protein